MVSYIESGTNGKWVTLAGKNEWRFDTKGLMSNPLMKKTAAASEKTIREFIEAVGPVAKLLYANPALLDAVRTNFAGWISFSELL